MNRFPGWRIADPKHPPFDGMGAELFGGRWNSIGRTVVYLSTSLSLAILERLVQTNALQSLKDCKVYSASLPGELIETVEIAALPDGWNAWDDPTKARAIGDGWIASMRTPILAVPSAIVSGEMNFLINVNHPRFGEISLDDTPREFPIDHRILRLIESQPAG